MATETRQMLLTDELPGSERRIMWKPTKGVHYVTVRTNNHIKLFNDMVMNADLNAPAFSKLESQL